MAIERYRPTMSGDVLRAWAIDAQAEIDRLRAENEAIRAENALLASQIVGQWNPDATTIRTLDGLA